MLVAILTLSIAATTLLIINLSIYLKLRKEINQSKFKQSENEYILHDILEKIKIIGDRIK